MKTLRWIFKRCMDCGTKLPSDYSRGDVCETCFEAFNGATIKEIFGED